MYCDVCGRNSTFCHVIASRLVNVKGKNIPVTYRAEICAYCGGERYDDRKEVDILSRAMSAYLNKKESKVAKTA